jgi:hypothetical protein
MTTITAFALLVVISVPRITRVATADFDVFLAFINRYHIFFIARKSPDNPKRTVGYFIGTVKNLK